MAATRDVAGVSLSSARVSVVTVESSNVRVQSVHRQGGDLARNYWYCWWGGALLVLAVGAVIPRSGLTLLTASVVMVASMVIWLALLLLGIYLARRTILRRFSFYWSLAVMVALVLVVYFTLAFSATGAGGNLALSPSPTQQTEVTNDLAVDAFVSHVIWLTTLLVVFIVGGWVVLSLWVSRVAADRGRSRLSWFWIAMVIPLISWIIVAAMKPAPPLGASSSLDTGPIPIVQTPKRKCPMCAEEILAEARKCKHCGEYLNA